MPGKQEFVLKNPRCFDYLGLQAAFTALDGTIGGGQFTIAGTTPDRVRAEWGDAAGDLADRYMAVQKEMAAMVEALRAEHDVTDAVPAP